MQNNFIEEKLVNSTFSMRNIFLAPFFFVVKRKSGNVKKKYLPFETRHCEITIILILYLTNNRLSELINKKCPILLYASADNNKLI